MMVTTTTLLQSRSEGPEKPEMGERTNNPGHQAAAPWTFPPTVGQPEPFPKTFLGSPDSQQGRHTNQAIYPGFIHSFQEV